MFKNTLYILKNKYRKKNTIIDTTIQVLNR